MSPAVPATMDRNFILITGGHGFIGSHVAHRLYSQGSALIRIVDKVPVKPSYFEGDIAHETIIGNLCDPSFAMSVVDGVSTVLHFAANMGGMGTIHEKNELDIYTENHLMTLNLLKACKEGGVCLFLYASSACVYPQHLQENKGRSDDSSVSLGEDDVYDNATSERPPHPQGLYGLEKLITELVLSQISSNLSIRIARFHNVYGPGGTWNGGREKVPAAFLRKALVSRRLGTGTSQTFEIWGSGTHRRSFLYINDAVDGILKLLFSDYRHPLNIGSDTSVSISELARIALTSVGVDPASVQFVSCEGKPVGVAARNSNNQRIGEKLGWAPSTSLEEGMKRTGAWMMGDMERVLSSLGSPDLVDEKLLEYRSSNVLDFKAEDVIFAILLPITSRGGTSPNSCLTNLTKFAQSLHYTTWRDLHSVGGTRFRIAIYLAIDHDDEFLNPATDSTRNKAEEVLRSTGFSTVVSLSCKFPRGHVCSLWRKCATRAWEDGCDYLGLFGDDITILDEGWMRRIHQEFHNMAGGLPFGIGCVAFTDTSFPGMPTFPIIHRRHMDVFHGIVVPEIFINQDGDPFLYQLYRRWNASKMIELRLSNGIGGSDDARYEKHHATDWSFDPLSDAVESVNRHIKSSGCNIPPTLTIDIVIPCYRVGLDILRKILGLKHSDTLTVMFIIIIDNPHSPHIVHLENAYGVRPDVRIRTNSQNLGASASRNRGMDESSAEWVYFLDDDIIPNDDILYEAEKVIRAHPDAAGFVGNTVFPTSHTIFQTAVHLAGVTYFWDIATKIAEDVPWGVTANLIVRRNVKDGIKFDLRYPKTGGGEDIDFCRLKRMISIQRGGIGFVAAPSVEVTHPWWGSGSRSYWRFYMWAYGDGILVGRFPELSYRDYSLNSAEFLLLAIAAFVVSLPFSCTILSKHDLTILLLKGVGSILLANIIQDSYRNLWRHPERNSSLNSVIKSGPPLVAAMVESTFIRMFSELGRLRGVVDRREWHCIGKRFDWFAGRIGEDPLKEERRNNLERAVLMVVIFSLCF